MADRTFLDWPFFDDRHRAFAADLHSVLIAGKR